MSVEINFKRAVFERVTEINDSNMEKELLHMITDRVVKNSSINKVLLEKGILAYNNDEVDNAVYVFCNSSLFDWTFEKFDSIPDAIKNAVQYINAYIICNGEVVRYDAIDDKTAYYYKNDNLRLVHLGE